MSRNQAARHSNIEELIISQSEKVERLKESLRHARSYAHELELLRSLTDEMTELRRLRDTQFFRLYQN